MKYSLIANWKMQLSVREQVALAVRIKKIKAPRGVQVTLCPSLESIHLVGQAITHSSVKLGAQNCSATLKGAYTGEVSLANLAALGCGTILIGHSERRAMGETDETIRQKLSLIPQVRSRSLSAILCIGEQADDRRKGYWKEILIAQLNKVLKNQPKELFTRLQIAYEPVWAIGSGNPLRPKEWSIICGILRGVLRKQSPQLESLPLLYGGSVDVRNAKQFLEAGADGLLVGTASQSFSSFQALIDSL